MEAHEDSPEAPPEVEEASPPPVPAEEPGLPGAARRSSPEVAVPTLEEVEARELRLAGHWRLRRFLITTATYTGVWFFAIALIHTGTPPTFFAALLLPVYLGTLLFVLRTPKRMRKVDKRPLAERISWQNKLMLSVLLFLALYLPFTFISNRIVPYAPIIEFFLFALALFLLLRLVGRSVGVAAGLESLPPASHRVHKQVIVPIEDPHYQQTLFLNFDFVDKGRGARTLAKRLEDALEASGVERDRRSTIIADLEDYREGFHFGFGLTRRGRERRRSGRERRSQVLRSVYTKFNQELEQTI